jgi:hypothetical protein
LVVAAICAQACTSGTNSPDARQSSPSTTATPSAHSAKPASAADVQPIFALRLTRYRSVTHLALVGHYVIFGACERCREGDAPNELVAADLRSGSVRRIAKSQYAGGQTDWVEGTGSYAVYTDQNRVQDDTNPATVWTLNAVDVVTHKTLHLASSHGRPNDGLPSPRAGDGYAVWASMDRPSDGAVLKVEQLHSGAKPEVVAKGSEYRDFGVAQGRVAFVDQAGRLMVTSLNGGQSEPVSYEAHAGSVRLGGDGNLIWPEPATGDPSSLWTARVLSRAAPRRVYAGDSQMQVVGSDFAAFLRLGGPEGDVVSVVSLRGSRPVNVAPNPYVPSRLVARGHLLAYATSEHLFEAGQVITIHVVRIATGHSSTPDRQNLGKDSQATAFPVDSREN